MALPIRLLGVVGSAAPKAARALRRNPVFTLKLRNSRTSRTKIESCDSVEAFVVSSGTSKVTATINGDPPKDFLISDAADFNEAFIENEFGHTSQIIRPGVIR